MLSAKLLDCQNKCYIIGNFNNSIVFNRIFLSQEDIFMIRCMYGSPSQNGMDIMEYFVEQQNPIPIVKHLIIQAYLDNNASRCGYCAPGFVPVAKALLDRNSEPTEAEARDSFGGNFCSCGNHQRHFPAVAEAVKNL
jgi:aerobic-type carbon monoxide dehydrogenase small subunit (CoxS/CutS family)